jgi:hypothetical protein
MIKARTASKVKTVILGAGASRGVSYRSEMAMDSPLDCDFYDLLLRLDVKLKNRKLQGRIYTAKDYISQRAQSGPDHNLWNSMEKLFYSLHVRETMRQMLERPTSGTNAVMELEDHFTTAIQALLRVAHGTQRCEFHQALFQRLNDGDAS